MPIYALLAFAKFARSDLSLAERRTVATIVATLESARKEKR